MPSLEVSRFMTIESGTGVNLSFFFFLIDRSTHYGMDSHSSIVTLARSRFKSTNLAVIELSIFASFFNFYYS